MVNGPLGELRQEVPRRMKIEQADGQLTVTRPTDRGDDRALHGLTRTLVANMVEGVTKGFERKLEIQGVGYRAALRGTALELSVGFSHQVVIEPPAGITFEVPTPTEIFVKGIDKQQRTPRFKVRQYTRCRRCGRPRAVYRKFGLCRICLREMAHEGYIPGMTKSSW